MLNRFAHPDLGYVPLLNSTLVVGIQAKWYYNTYRFTVSNSAWCQLTTSQVAQKLLQHTS